MKSVEATGKYVRTILRTPEFLEFYESLPAKVQTKFQYVMNVIATVYNVSTKFVKHLEKTDLYEMRVSIGNNEYRTVLFAIDHDNFIESKNIILLNGFLKKDNKDYRKQIEIATRILHNLEL
ncbi:MAG: type II toxin-antitoxin system RelE/ParE family toxin [Muribaculaceae bacterium]|nr:type II toxin-antitoxin system RelE/ParE family toxin [Muribaculaceae bacterium]